MCILQLDSVVIRALAFDVGDLGFESQLVVILPVEVLGQRLPQPFTCLPQDMGDMTQESHASSDIPRLIKSAADTAEPGQSDENWASGINHTQIR